MTSDALACIARGWVPVRVEHRGKIPDPKIGWQHLRPTTDDVAKWKNCNLGVLLGSASGWLVDVDLDCAEAVELAPHYLPDTWVFGRASKPASHWLYVAEDVQSHGFRDADGTPGTMMLEIRGETENGPGHQTVIPPSTHTTGEAIEWSPDHGDAQGGPRVVAAAALKKAATKLARATFYMRGGISADEARAAEAKHEPKARPAVVRATSRQLGDVYERARRYLAKMPEAVSQQGGHEATFRAALALVRGFQLDEGTALALLASDYNPRCQPTWSDRELQHKVAQAAKARVASGYLIGSSP